MGRGEGAVGKSVGVLSGDMQDEKLNAKAQGCKGNAGRDLTQRHKGAENAEKRREIKFIINEGCKAIRETFDKL